jgi:hypothetical protein
VICVPAFADDTPVPLSPDVWEVFSDSDAGTWVKNEADEQLYCKPAHFNTPVEMKVQIRLNRHNNIMLKYDCFIITGNTDLPIEKQIFTMGWRNRGNINITLENLAFLFPNDALNCLDVWHKDVALGYGDGILEERIKWLESHLSE